MCDGCARVRGCVQTVDSESERLSKDWICSMDTITSNPCRVKHLLRRAPFPVENEYRDKHILHYFRHSQQKYQHPNPQNMLRPIDPLKTKNLKKIWKAFALSPTLPVQEPVSRAHKGSWAQRRSAAPAPWLGSPTAGAKSTP